jgi:hypothetical protein
MRENRPYGLEGGESGSTGLPYPYRARGGYGLSRSHPLPSGGLAARGRSGGAREASTVWRQVATGDRWLTG